MLKESRSRDVYCRGVWWDSDQYRERRGVTSTPILLADVASRLFLYLPVITCCRRFLGAHGSEGATAAMEAGRRHLHAAWRRTQKPRRVREPLGAAGSAAAGGVAGEGAGGKPTSRFGLDHGVGHPHWVCIREKPIKIK